MNNAQSASIIKNLCKEKSITISSLLKESNIRKSLIYDMEKRDKTPSAEILEQIADYLDCSVDYILGRTELSETANTSSSDVQNKPTSDNMYNAQDAADRIKLKAKEKNIHVKKLLEECDLNKNAISSMVSRGSWLQANNLAKIADYLDCSVDYLLGRAELPDAIHPSDLDTRNGTTDYIMTSSLLETSLLIEFRNLNSQGQDYILQTMDMVKDKYKKSDSVSQMEEIG